MRFRVPRDLVQATREALRAMRSPDLALWVAYILLFPIYVFSSGLPQPGDLLVVPLFVAVLAAGPLRVPRAGVRPARAVLAFTAYVVLSSLFWTLVTAKLSFSGKDGFLAAPLFYSYNAGFFVLTLVLYRRHRERFLWLTLQAVLATVVIQALLSLVIVAAAGVRSIGTFNNPNQLGYFAIASASILTLGRRRVGLNGTAAAVGLVLCAYLAVLSSSKAALGSVAILAAVTMINNPGRALLASVVFAAFTLFPNPLTRAIDRAELRIRTDEHMDFMQERGYDRILANPRFWLLGSGEGGTRRFKVSERLGAHEIHSSVGTLFFSYGVIGLALFAVIAFRIVAGTSVANAVLLLPVAAYGLTHQGLRSTLLWVLLAFYTCLKDLGVLARPRARRKALPPDDPARPVDAQST